MINYSIQKPQALCGHFIKINNKEEHDRMKQIADGCGFSVENYYESSLNYLSFNNDIHARFYERLSMSGQEITLSELEELAKLSKLKFPCEMEVSDDGISWQKQSIDGFYKDRPVFNYGSGTYTTFKHYRLNPHQFEIEKLEAEIKAAQERIEELKKIGV